MYIYFIKYKLHFISNIERNGIDGNKIVKNGKALGEDKLTVVILKQERQIMHLA